ncbi:transporter [Methylobacterium organophilum]|uniref:transporter n=1 Tax=Methylobacterium organophilum TaxID=410 RepID=UPI001F130F45|nr:transporter [Methylobacterium organophilum]UMY16498.1 transporter [Methylobacterium organophilum]
MVLLATATCLPSRNAQAQEIMPYDFTVLPAGTTLAMGYYAYGHNTDYRITGGPTLRDSGLEVHAGIARLVHYGEIGSIRGGVQVFQIFGGLQDVRIGCQPVASTFGAQNVTLSAFFWPYINVDSQTAVMVLGFINPPTGTYDRFAALNLGDNRVRGTVQLGLQQGFGEHLGLDLAYDAQFYGENDRAFPGTGLLTQAPTHRIQAWLNWRWNPSFSTSIGYTGIWGGAQNLNGLPTGARTETQRIRFHGGYFIDPTLQIGLELNHDLHSEGGFRQDFGAIMRVLKVF